MENSRFYSNINTSEGNRGYFDAIKSIINSDPHVSVYVLDRPLSANYDYDYEGKALVVLVPNHKLLFLNLGDNEEEFGYFVDEFCDDIYNISDRHSYREVIDRPRKWKPKLVIKIINPRPEDISLYFENSKCEEPEWKRKVNIIYSLLLGCINDIKKIGTSTPETLLDKVKHNIVLFDGEQTRFIYEDFNKKTISVQGLSGTGKTELLLHRLKNVYINEEDSTIFWTCHNRVLANTMISRVNSFFNSMGVNKQIEWRKRLWISHAWGSAFDQNSGFYSFLCRKYDIPFIQYHPNVTYEFIFGKVLERLNAIPENEFEYALDYIFIDERQDFPNVMIQVCEKVARKMVCWAGDIYQDIFETRKDGELNVDVVLSRCYRTDPRTLMFSHAIGMGLFDVKKLDWQTEDGWKSLGYNMELVDKVTREVHLSRDPIDRFQELQDNGIESVRIIQSTKMSTVISIISEIKVQNPTVLPDDICIIVLGDGNSVFEYMDKLAIVINNDLGWSVNRAVESKEKKDNMVYMTNTNNVKGLEFPFVICVGDTLENGYRSRNTYYTMLSRSFLQTFLLLNDISKIPQICEGLNIINQKGYIKTIFPTQEEMEDIKRNKINFNEKINISLEEFLTEIFIDLGINDKARQKSLTEALLITKFNKFDRNKVIDFINQNKAYF